MLQGDWNGNQLFPAPRLVDATLAQLPALPNERQLTQYVDLLQELPLDVVAVGTVRDADDWPALERLRGCLPQHAKTPKLQFNVEYPACGLPPQSLSESFGWRVVGGCQKSESEFRALCAASRDVTVVLPRAVDADPVELSRWVRAAQEWGASAVELVGKEGRPWTTGVENLVKFCQGLRSAAGMQLTWSSYDSFGLGLAQAISAHEAGVESLRATFLGGHGTIPLESLLTHLVLEGTLCADLTAVSRVVNWLQSELQFDVSPTLPIVGGDAFRFAGHLVAESSAVSAELTSFCCTGVPSELLGRNLQLEVGPLSGASNVRHWLSTRGLHATPEITRRILAQASQQDQVLSELELIDLYHHLLETEPCAVGRT